MLRFIRFVLGVVLFAALGSALGCIADAQEDLCVRGAELCGGGCVDLAHDVDNCGACGRNCAAGFRCEGGECRCDLPFSQCEGGCYDLDQDPTHCGSCERACAPGIACETGVCIGDCAAGLLRCEGRCVDPRKDPEHCGGCGLVCVAGATCRETDQGASCTCEPNASWPCPESAVAATSTESGGELDVADVVTITTSDGDDLVVVAGTFGGAPVDFGGQILTAVGLDDLFVAAYRPDLSLAWTFVVGATGREQLASDLEVAPNGNLYFVASIRAGMNGAMSPGDLPVTGLRQSYQGAVFDIDPRLGATSRVRRVGLVQDGGGAQFLDAAVAIGGQVVVVGHHNGASDFIDNGSCHPTLNRNAFVARLDLDDDQLFCHGLLGAGNPNNNGLANPYDLDVEVDAAGALHVIGAATEANVRMEDGTASPPPPLSLQRRGNSKVTTGYDVVYRPVGNGYVFDHALILGDPQGNRAARLLRGARAKDGTLALVGWFTVNTALLRRDPQGDETCGATFIAGSGRQAVALGLASGTDCPSWVWSSGLGGNDGAQVVEPIPDGFLVLGGYEERISAGDLDAERSESGQGYFLLSFATSGSPRWLLGDLEGGGLPSSSRHGGLGAIVGTDEAQLFWAGPQRRDGPTLPTLPSQRAQAFLGRFRLGL